MTITYSLETSTSNLTNFKRLMFRWRGSIWQCVWKDLLIWLILYAMLSCCYRFILSDSDRGHFEDFVHLAANYTSAIPLTFMLGFYVSLVLNRWWEIFMNIAWPDNIAISIATYVQGNDESARIQRRTIVRYLVLAEVLVLRDISSSVKKRFPSLNHVVNAGLMTEEEQKMIESISINHAKYWMPIEWCCTMLRRIWKRRKLEETHLHTLVEAILQYRGNLGMLMAYDWISVPLVYTQVANLSILSYFGLCLLSSQYVAEGTESASSKPKLSTKDFYIPFFTILQFIFFFGWLKVAEVLINPLGEDDDDFEVNYIIDRNLQVGYSMVDEMFEALPKLDKDPFWDDMVPDLPHTRASMRTVKNDNPMVGSCADITISKQMSRVVTIPEEDESGSVSMNSIRRRRRITSTGQGSDVLVDSRPPDGIHSCLVSESSKEDHALDLTTDKKEDDDADRQDNQSLNQSVRTLSKNSPEKSASPSDESNFSDKPVSPLREPSFPDKPVLPSDVSKPPPAPAPTDASIV